MGFEVSFANSSKGDDVALLEERLKSKDREIDGLYYSLKSMSEKNEALEKELKRLKT